MRLNGFVIAAALVCILGSADAALAWGPTTHIGLGSSVLQNLAWLPAGIAAILAKHGAAYLYGNIAADVVFAKRWSRVKQFCHHWSTGFRLLEDAPDDRSRAFAYGYLSHLAADTVAHGKYVPMQIAVSGCSLHFGHLYWELRADAVENEQAWQLLERVMRFDHDDHHAYLQRYLCETFLPYDLNRLLFDGMNALTMRRAFRRTVGAWSRCSRWYLPGELVRDYRAESFDRIQAILTDGARSALLREDPNGTSALMHVRVKKREARKLKRRGLPVHRRHWETAAALAPMPAWVQSPVAATYAAHRVLKKTVTA